MPETTCDIGLIGLAVMGQNLVLNMADHGYSVAVYNRTTSVMEDFIAKNKAEEYAGFWKEFGQVLKEGPAEDFCAVVTQRRHVDDTALRIQGQAARDWMLVAQAFAGLPTDGPTATAARQR